HSDPRCLEKPEPGQCRIFAVKWYYDEDSNGCLRFWYSGCGGNQNRFETEDKCKETCLTV
uniref:BPTI/Kunitz inhibitor domain-containing protein n=1 Tax=Leptobrachium leishanense TaxID=445787 RepID=A0A8C5MQ53_9ANUR